MLHHVVMWKLKDHAEGADRAANVRKAQALLQSCAALVPGIQRFEVGVAQPGLECSYDLVLNSSFTDPAALAAYQQHPEHVAIKPFMKAVVEARQCMDYET
ncbi:MAG: Dabb family protein [Hydrogenophaga sp.]|uniref:Dabb family protein n=1 Tax=Hydrogenophaga sp. TaxID=1904254 RepID=UPI00271CD75B|nr:Dabb family protein [Hydrogenophaga sp.]MDO9149067.1 Dabb family protein [Hydrogenophaga sp.]MDO9606642.1 Dabb family protein [Hydrogenophaga sp.]MDP2162766.1 Dabb family protein [Hydrogenophaga sp.]MDP3476937.1 Dabb family protein [Hydrogenophaga sp.]